MAYTEWYCNNASGSNFNAGSTNGAPTVAATAGTLGGTGNKTFTAGAGTPWSGLAGDGTEWCSVYQEGTDTVAKAIGRITSVGGGGASVTVDAWLGGTVDADETRLVVGGYWKGPNAAEDFPFGFAGGTFKNAAGDCPRVNFATGTYLPTAALSASVAGPIVWQGLGGKATFDFDNNGVTMLSIGAVHQQFVDLVFCKNNAGTALGVSAGADRCEMRRCVVHGARRQGIYVAVGRLTLVECEVYDCSKESASYPALDGYSAFNAIRCMVHDNAASGVRLRDPCVMMNCMVFNNVGWGIYSGDVANTHLLVNVDCYGNSSGNGIGSYDVASLIVCENCNSCEATATGTAYGWSTYTGGVTILSNCGSQGNKSARSSGLVYDLGAVTYSSTGDPWTNAAEGDFVLNEPLALGAGRGAFTFTGTTGYTDYANTISIPDIGACQTVSGGGAGYPTEGDVQEHVVFGPTNNFEGTFVVPPEAKVEAGYKYGNAEEFSGSAPVGADWSEEERAQIRYRLNIDGTKTPLPADTDLPVVNVTQVNGDTVTESGTIDANVVQVNSNATAAATLKLFADMLDQATGQIDNGTFNLVIDGKGLIEALQIIAAGCAGQTAGAGSGTETYLGLDKATPRIQVGISAGVGTTKNRASVDYL